jgi:hypothetical protein
MINPSSFRSVRISNYPKLFDLRVPMADSTTAWDSHSWMLTRKLEIGSDVTLIQHTCQECGRNFVDEIRSGNLYAVHLSPTDFDRLSDETTARWLSEPCPGEHVESDADVADLKTRFG